MGTQLSLPKGAQFPQSSAHVCYGQTAGGIKMLSGTEVGLDRAGDSALDGDPPPPQKGEETAALHFLARVLWPNGRMDQIATWYRGRPRPRPHCVRRGPAPPKKGHSPQFSSDVSCGQMAGLIKMPLGTCKYDLTVGQLLYRMCPLIFNQISRQPKI